MAYAESITPERGQRGMICGMTGSGKTTLEVWLLERIEYSPTIIYDTKGETKFRKLPNSKVTTRWDGKGGVLDLAENDQTVDYILFRPSMAETRDPAQLDQYLLRHYDELRGHPLFLDEVNQFYRPGSTIPGPGIHAILSRGRSRGITALMASQRPSGIPRGILTESQKFYVFRLNDNRDRKTLGEVIPDFEDYPVPDFRKYQFYYYAVGDEAPRLHNKVSIDRKYDTGYVSEAGEEGGRLSWLTRRT